MRWNDTSKAWASHFAFFPILIGDTWIWWETYERRVKFEIEVGPVYDYRLVQ